MNKEAVNHKEKRAEETGKALFEQKNWRLAWLRYLRDHARQGVHLRIGQEQILCEDLEKYHRDLLEKRPMEHWRRDFRFCYDFFGADLETDYFGNAMIGRNLCYKRKIVTDRKNMFATDYLITPDVKSLCRDKVKSAVVWADWYKRRWCTSTPKTPANAETLRWVSNGKGSVVVKPPASFGGKGVEVYDISTDELLQSAVEAIQGRKWIVEERIIQTGLLHDLNPSSVNSLRIITGMHSDGRLELMCAYLRLGHAGAITDNFSAGGLAHTVDIDNGTIQVGTDGHGNHHYIHPDTGVQVAGLRVPQWEEAVEFCFAAHRHAPKGLVFAGWDVCISDDGLSLIEVNTCPGFNPIIKNSHDYWGSLKTLLEEADKERRKRL